MKITQEQYEEAQELVWNYEEQVKNESNKSVCPECGYPKFKKSFEKFERCEGCEWTNYLTTSAHAGNKK